MEPLLLRVGYFVHMVSPSEQLALLSIAFTVYQSMTINSTLTKMLQDGQSFANFELLGSLQVRG